MKGDRGELLHYLEMMASMPAYPRWYQPGSGAECEELEDQRLRYIWKAAWLKTLLLGEPEPPYSEYPFILRQYPAAFLSARLFTLAVETRLRHSELKQATSSGSHLWFACEVSDSLYEMHRCGLSSLIETGVADPIVIGKGTFLSENAAVIAASDYDKAKQPLQFRSVESKEDLYLNFRSYVEGQAYIISKRNKFFRKNIYKPYNEARASVNNVHRKCKGFQISCLLPNGTRSVTKKGQGLPEIM